MTMQDLAATAAKPKSSRLPAEVKILFVLIGIARVSEFLGGIRSGLGDRVHRGRGDAGHLLGRD